MDWEYDAIIVLAGIYLAVRVFLRLFAAEYSVALEARRIVNQSRRKVAAKLAAEMAAVERQNQARQLSQAR